ncbi:WHG domain-containing protein [Nostoc sp. CHAB 5834]|nr:WHG domain-containing protein [Nostoc sp. CHAB 5834]
MREQVLAVALRHLAEGASGLPAIREIAAEIGVTHRALYRHYADKAALNAAVAAEGFRRLCEAVSVRAAQQGLTRRAVMEAYVGFALTESGLYDLMFSLPADGLMRRPEPGDEVRRLVGLASDAFATKGASADAVRDQVIAAWGMAHGLTELWRGGALRAEGRQRAAEYILKRLADAGLVEGRLDRP